MPPIEERKSTAKTGKPHKGLYDDGELYDRVVRASIGSADIGFYLAIASQSNGKLLELGCGTGRLTLPLCAAGYEVTGLDNSGSMLRAARSKAASASGVVRLMKADFRSFELNEKFDLALIPHNTLGHLLTLDELESCLLCVRAHLEDDGLFVIDMSNPHPGQFDESPDVRALVCAFTDDSGEQVEIFENAIYDRATQIHDRTWIVECAGQTVRQIRFRTRTIFPMELEAILRFCGFSVQDKYGNYELAPYRSCSDSQLLVCRKR